MRRVGRSAEGASPTTMLAGPRRGWEVALVGLAAARLRPTLPVASPPAATYRPSKVEEPAPYATMCAMMIRDLRCVGWDAAPKARVPPRYLRDRVADGRWRWRDSPLRGCGLPCAEGARGFRPCVWARTGP